MSAFVLPIVAGLLVFVQVTWLGNLSIAGAQPNLSLFLIMLYGHRAGVQRGQVAGFAVGLLQDALGSAPLGFYAVLGLVAGAIAGSTRGAFRSDSIIAPPMLALIVMIGRGIAALFLSLILGLPSVRENLFSLASLVDIGFMVVVSPIVFAALGAIMDRTSTERY